MGQHQHQEPRLSRCALCRRLIGPDTVNTLPLHTIAAVLDHTIITRAIDQDVAAAQAQIESLAGLGIDFAQITADLQIAGVEAFAASFRSLLQTIAARISAA